MGNTALPLSALLYDAPHSLQEAAHSPRELVNGHVNVDGTGVAWWMEGRPEPLRYVTSRPPWSDPNLPSLSRALGSRTILAAVRSATPGMPFGADNVAPFTAEGLAMAHNGWIGGFRGEVGRSLLSRLGDDNFARLVTMSDSLMVFLLLLQHLDEHPGAEVEDAVRAVVDLVAKIVMAHDQPATLNLVVAAPGRLVAARTSVSYRVNSLYWRSTEQGTWLASEAMDDDLAWQEVPESSLLSSTPDDVTIDSLDHPGGAHAG